VFNPPRSRAQDNIPPDVIQALQPLLSHPDFQPAKIKKVSQAAFGLCSWVRAMETYDRVAKVVAPKRKALTVGAPRGVIGIRK
jgi:dynein heavy chain